jgi:hypothetical protein
MPEFSSIEQIKIQALKDLQAAGTDIDAYELVQIDWPAPAGTIYYAVMQTDKVASLPPPVSPIVPRMVPSSSPDWFVPMTVGDTIGDEEVTLDFSDPDGAMADLLLEHGEGLKVTLLYWFPQEELLLPSWEGHLRNEDESEPYMLSVKAVRGYRSSEGTLPSGGHFEHCIAVFGGLLATQAEINEHGCPYNRQIAGGVGNLNPATSQAWTFCNRRDHQSCIDRGVNPLFHLSHNTIQTIVANGQTKGPTLFSTTFGNQTNLPDAVPVVMGVRRVSGQLIAFRRDLNNNNHDRGWFQTLNELSRGPIQSISSHWVDIAGVRYNDPTHYTYRLGQFGQTPNYLSTHGFSNIANFRQTCGWIDPSTVGPADVSSSAIVTGLNDIRIYTDEDSFYTGYTTNRAWQLARILCDKIWGYGYDYARLDIIAWGELANWCDQYVRFNDDNGDSRNHQRTACNVELRGKKVQQQIEDMCRAGRFSRPFLFNGKVSIVPLRVQTTAELAAAPVFTDEGTSPNIVFDRGMSSLRISKKSDLDLPNRLEASYDKAADDWKETPLRPLEDVPAQLRAGRVLGDSSRKINSKQYNLLGITDENQAIKVQQALLDLGEFDSGGLRNNLQLKFTIWYLDSLILHPAKVIKVVSSRTTRYGFDYFRVMDMKRRGDLTVELVVQAYNHDYMLNLFETAFDDIVTPPPIPVPPGYPQPTPPPIPPVDLPEPVISFTADGFLEIY